MPRNVAKGCYELIEIMVNPRATDQFHLGLWLIAVRCHALDDLLVGLADEGVEEVVQGILANRLELVGMLVVARLGTVVDMAFAGRPAWSSLRLALRAAAVRQRWRKASGCEAIRSTGAGGHAVGREGGCYGVLGHDGSIEGRNDVRLLAEGAGGRRVYVARVARVLDAMHDGRVAVVGIRLRGLALESALESPVRAGVAAAARDGRRPCARCYATAGHTRLARRSLSSWRSCIRHKRQQKPQAQTAAGPSSTNGSRALEHSRLLSARSNQARPCTAAGW